MVTYFTPNVSGQSFELFSLSHLLTLAILLFVVIIIFLFRKRLRHKKLNRIVRLLLSTILILSEISLHSWLLYSGQWGLLASLPLHLSSISLLLSIMMLITKSYSIFEFTYFAGMGSAIQAMLTPDLGVFTYPHFRYIHFFISHGGIVWACMFMVFVEGFKPTVRSLGKAFVILNIYVFMMFIVNTALGSNYLYIMRKPVNPSIFDLLGPWPWYIIPLEVVALSTFFLLYVPFWVNRQLSTR